MPISPTALPPFGRLVPYGLFMLLSMTIFFQVPGDDLAASYVGCRLLAADLGAHLYDMHPQFFNIVDTPPWVQIAKETGVRGTLHPYVQTPLWA